MNSLAEFYPELLEEWDYEKNTIKPEKVSYGSGKKVWWKCKHGHSWYARINSRTNKKSGCPYCVGQKVSDENSLAIKYPELLKEWDYEKNTVKPEDLSYGSNKKVWWKCKDGNSWEARIDNRVKKIRDVLNVEKRCFNMKSLVESHPELVEQWDYEKNTLKPEEISFGSNKKVWWKCKDGHSWEVIVNSRTSNKTGCPYCAGQKVSNKNSLIELYPELLEEWDYEKNVIKPEEVSFGSNKKVWWKCKKGHSWELSPNSRSFHKSGCPICSRKKVSSNKNLAAKYPELVEEWDYEKNTIKPEEVAYGSGQKVWWKCKKGHSWRVSPNSRTNRKSGCPKCRLRKFTSKENLSITHPELLNEWDYEKNVIKPEDVSFGSNKKVWWRCKKSHSWEARISNRSKGNSGCPYCSELKASIENSITLKHPELLEEWDYEKNTLKPNEVSFGSIKKVWWKCKDGHSWESRISNRAKRNSGCPYCSGQRISSKNSLAAKCPELLEEWDYENNTLKPEEVFYGSRKKVWWKCKDGHSWQQRINSRTFKNLGCPQCRKKRS